MLGATEIELRSLLDGRLVCRHERARPAKALPDPIESSVPVAQVPDAIPKVEVHHRPLWIYQELIDG